MKLGDKVRGFWRSLDSDRVPVVGTITGWDRWHGELMATLALDAPVHFVTPPRYDGDIRREVTIEARGLTLVEAGPALEDGDVVSLASLGHGDSLSRAGMRKLGLAS